MSCLGYTPTEVDMYEILSWVGLAIAVGAFFYVLAKTYINNKKRNG